MKWLSPRRWPWRRDEIRQRDGYRRILQSCERAQKDGYKGLWVDTCCIDKRSSAELFEAINSMHRWYENAKMCYAYLHDVPDPWFPTSSDNERYPDFSRWREWFSRGWTLQELIIPSNVHSGAYIHTWALRKPSVCCSNHVVGGSSDDKSRGPSLFADGSAGREYADAIWRREESISPSSAGDHTTKESLHGFTTSGPA
ncbi:hypothetical protein SCLCIDRAFT_1224488, partial [Scleroderma citrinum Foug A]